MTLLVIRPGELKHTLEGIQVGPNEYSLRPMLIRGEEVRDVVKMQTEYTRNHPEFKPMPIITSQLLNYAHLAERTYDLLDEVGKEGNSKLNFAFRNNLKIIEKDITNFGMNINIWKNFPPWYSPFVNNLYEVTSEIKRKIDLGGIAA